MPGSGKFDIDYFPTSESAKRMLTYVTANFYDHSYVGKWLYQVIGMEYDQIKKIAEELPYQFFPETATWGLAYHEIKWGLPVREDLPYEVRRTLIYEKRDLRLPITPYQIEQLLDAVTDFDVCVADILDAGEFEYVPPHPNVFCVYCIGDGILDTKSLRMVLDSVKQSHTTYVITDLVLWELDHRKMEYLDLVDVNIHTDMPFWGCMLLDGSQDKGHCIYDMVASMAFNAKMGLYESLTGGSVVTTRNLAYLDGSEMLDGSRLLNSIYKKEVI